MVNQLRYLAFLIGAMMVMSLVACSSKTINPNPPVNHGTPPVTPPPEENAPPATDPSIPLDIDSGADNTSDVAYDPAEVNW
jgi:hypothetical protein